jgi:hypothetical protein
MVVLPLTVILLVTGLLAGMLASQAVTGYRNGQIAAEEVRYLSLLLSAQVRLIAERVATNRALAAERPMPEALAVRLAEARRESSRLLDAAKHFTPDGRGQDAGRDGPAAVDAIITALEQDRIRIDNVLSADRGSRSYGAIRAITEATYGVVARFADPVLEAVVDTSAIDPELAGLLNAASLAIDLRETAGRIAIVFIAHMSAQQAFDAADVAEVRVLQGRVTELDRQLGKGLQIAGATHQVAPLVATMRRIYRDQTLVFLDEQIEAGARDGHYALSEAEFSQRYLNWSNTIIAVWEEVLREATARVDNDQEARLIRLCWTIGAIAAVLACVVATLVTLHRYVVVPMTRLGGSMLRIASGERTEEQLSIRGPREVTALAAAVEIFRRAAVVADATETRERLAMRQRSDLVRQALEAARTMREPSQKIEETAVRLALDLDAAGAEIATTGIETSSHLASAALAVRAGFATMRDLTAADDHALEALDEVNTDGRLGASRELADHLEVLRTAADHRDTAVRSFLQPVIAALIELSVAEGRAHHSAGDTIRGALDGPFGDVQEIVVMTARMHDAVTRATEASRQVANEEIRASDPRPPPDRPPSPAQALA